MEDSPRTWASFQGPDFSSGVFNAYIFFYSVLFLPSPDFLSTAFHALENSLTKFHVSMRICTIFLQSVVLKSFGSSGRFQQFHRLCFQ